MSKFDTLQDHEFRRDEWAAQESQMNWEKIPCRHCGMTFENLQDCLEHERCHVASTTEVKTDD